MAANHQAIAWYLKRSEALLAELQQRVESLSVRGGQLAGFSGAVLALAGGNAQSMLAALQGAARDGAGVALLVGALSLIAAFVAALRGALLRHSGYDLSAVEVASYTSARFTEEPDLWRVQLRTIRGLLDSIEAAIGLNDRVVRAIGRAERLFSLGLLAVGVALVILIAVVTF